MSIGLKPFVGLAAEAYNAPLARLNIWDGSVRSGKTINSLLRWSRWVRQEAPPGGLLIVGKTERTVKQNVVDPLLDIWGSRAHYSAGNHELILFGRRMIIVGANDLRAETKIRGITLAGAYGDEVTTWEESFFQMLMSRLSVTGASFLGTTNPDSPAHWLNKGYLMRAAELGLRRWRFTLDDNPHLDPEFVASLKREYTGLWYKRFILGQWVVAEGAIFDMLDPDIHLVDDLPNPAGITWGGGDYGTTNPTVYLAATLEGTRGLTVHNEWYYDSQKKGRQKTNPEYVQAWFDWQIKHGYPLKRSYIDPAANSFILQLWRDGVKGVHPGDNNVLDGIREVASLLSTGLMRFHRDSTRELWDEMSSYTWDPKAQERGEDKPMKTNDHGPDALRYLVRGTRQSWRRLMRDNHAAA